MRTYYCGLVDKKIINHEIKLCGWINRIRNHGKVIFINLRDREGIVQIVVEDDNQELFNNAAKIHNEYVLSVHGKVRARPEGLVNYDMPTGAIEVVASSIEILARSEALPFNIDNYQEVSEELRLKYRYLDMRRSEIGNKLIFRAKVVKKIREYFDALNFVEVETPILTKTTPEGARDFLVPSRNAAGQFYALPQSPQIFKQLLMAGGLDRYYQIARCFRDEDLRADRQLEFTQLDVELSFTHEEQIMQIHEELMRQLFAQLLNVALPKQFPKLTFKQAIEKYGVDKPDLRIPLELVDIADLVADCGFEVFARAAENPLCRVAALKLPGGTKLSRKQLDGYTEFVAIYGLKGLAHIKINDLTQGIPGLQSSLLKFLAPEVVENILERIQAATGDIVFFAADDAKIVNEAFGALRVKLGHDHSLVAHGWQPLWVVDWPMFEKTESGWTFMHHPFTSPVNTNPEEVIANPGMVMARAYDMVLNGTELGGGSIRISNRAMQMAIFKVLDMNKAEEDFGHLIEAFKYGYPPEGGCALGIDRMIMLMTGAKSIRDVIAFPKTQTGTCPLTQAPSEVTEEQLKELKIKIS
ncbi:aspartate--tRNA ligase [Gammaproteobacteria bacterium]